jgi:hypothetical protein
MSTEIDSGSATITVEAKDAKCGFQVGSEVLLLHCTKGANLALADSPMDRRLLHSFSFAATWKAKVRVRTTGKSVDAFGELTSRWAFGFLQFALIWVEEYTYAGWTSRDGSIQWNLKLGYSANPCLDAGEKTSGDTRWPIMGDVGVRPAGPGQYDIECSHGDHPNGGAALRERNLLTNQQNYLYSARRDVSYWVVFVARDPSNVIRPLASFDFHTIWHAEMQWFRPTLAPSTAIKHQAFLPSAVSAGAPSEPSVARLISRPTGPTANDQSADTDAAWQSRRPPVLTQFSSHMIGMRDSFVPQNQAEY